MSVWEHYGIVCDQIGCARIPKHRFPDHSVNGVLHHIKMSQPDVFDALEERRRALWVGQNGKNLFDSGMSVLFTSHALAKHWYWNHVTRTWHHPDFVPFAQQDHAAMRADLMISEIVIDEPERDIILNLIPESLCDWLKRMKRRHPGWNSKSCKERYKIYESEKAANEIPGKREFDEIDELMHLNLDDLCLQEVNYEAIPFGFDQKGTGIYSVKTGEGLNLGVQDWLLACKARLTFLTTEAVISDVVTQAYDKLREAKQRTRTPIVLDLNAPSYLFPVNVPLVIDRRAAKRNITALVDEILGANPNAVIVANGSDITDPRVLNFQRAKGVNGLDERDVYLIVTCLSPDHYAELNAIGQWLELPTIIRQQYEDEISQAVGRNTGFRKSEKSTKTMLICSTSQKRTEELFSRCVGSCPASIKDQECRSAYAGQ